MKTNSSILYLFILFACAILSPVFGSPAPSCDVGEACVELRDDFRDLLPTAQAVIKYIQDPNNAATINNPSLCFYSGNTTVSGQVVPVHTRIKGAGNTLETLIGKKLQILADVIIKAGQNSVGWEVDPEWRATSKALAQHAEKPVYALLGKDVSPTSVWLLDEKPALIANPNVGTAGFTTYQLQTNGNIVRI